jgi:signal transduction histidine kinase
VHEPDQIPSAPPQRPRAAHGPPQPEPGAGDAVHELLRAAAGLGDQDSLDALLDQVVATAMRLTGSRYGALAIIGEDGQLTTFRPAGLDSVQLAGLSEWPQGHGVLGELAASRSPVRLADLPAHPGAAGFPAGHPPMRSFLGAPIRVGDQAVGSLYLTDKRAGGLEGPGEFGDEDERAIVTLAAVAGVAMDNARLHAEGTRQRQWVRAHAEVTRRLLSDDEPTGVLTMVAQQALQMSGADLVVIALPAAAGSGLLAVDYAAGMGASEAVGMTWPTNQTAGGIVLASGTPLAIDDFSADGRVAPVARQHLGLGPAVIVPLGPAGEARGVLTAGRRRGSPPLPPAAVEMVTTFAAQAGLGIELAERRRVAQRVALYADRDRIARDLHDLVIQRLFATGMSLQGAASLIPAAEAAERVQRAVDDLDDTIRDIRSAIFRLQDRGDPGLPGVQARIVAVAEETSAGLGFAPWLRMDGRLDSRVPGAVAEELLAALREALSNVARHAAATRADVMVEAGSLLVLAVRDNGVGLGEPGPRSGLANLAQRAGALGGTLRLTAVPGGGTELTWSVPLPVAGPAGPHG